GVEVGWAAPRCSGQGARPKPEAGGRRSAALDDHQAVALGVAQPEQRRHRVAHTADLGVHVHAGGPRLRVESVDVFGLQADARLAVARRPARGRRGEGDRGDGVAGSHFDPPLAVAEGDVGALLEAELLEVELDLAVLVGHRDDDGADLRDISLGAGHRRVLLKLGYTHLRRAYPTEVIAVIAHRPGREPRPRSGPAAPRTSASPMIVAWSNARFA